MKRKRQLVEWQLKTVRNQLDLHFTFNALNAIGSSIYKEKKEVAYDIFTQFSHLFRKSLEDSKQLTRTLKHELEFVKNYISIQKFRFDEVFDYKIQVDKNVNIELSVPKMLIQTFVENAIYHGLIPKKTDGMLDIRISQDKRSLNITIEDNGVGRHAKVEQKKSTGRGLELMQNYLKLLNKNNSEHLNYKITDLFEGEKAAGTKIDLSIPLSFKFN